MSLGPDQTAVLLIAHGSRRAQANADLVLVADQLRERSDYVIVECSYLELAEPTIPQGAARCIELGAKHVLMMPYFLSAGSHVTKDLERHRNEFQAAYPDANFTLCPPLGVHPQMIDIVLDRLEEQVEAD